MAALPFPSHATSTIASSSLGNAFLPGAISEPDLVGKLIAGGLGWAAPPPAQGTPLPMPVFAVATGGGSVGYPH